MNAKHSLANATRRLHVITHTDHTCAHANLDLSEMDILVQVQSTVSKAFRFLLNSAGRFCYVGCLSLLFILVTWQAIDNLFPGCATISRSRNPAKG